MPASSPRRASIARLVSGLAAVVFGCAIATTPLSPMTASAVGATDNVGQVGAASQPNEPVLLIGVSGLAWSDAESGDAPVLAQLADSEAAIGSLVVRTVRPVTCPVAGWLSLSAGARATAATTNVAGGGADCPELTEPVDGGVPGWAGYLDAQHSASRTAPIGLLGQTLAEADVSAMAFGPGAAIALAGTDGRLEAAYEPIGDLSQQVAAAARAGAQLVVVDAGAVRVSSTDRTADERATQSEEVSAAIGLALTGWRAATGERGRIVIASLADDDGGAGLRVLATDGPGLTGQEVGSPGTHHADLAQIPDVTATLTLLTTGRAAGSGTELVTSGAATTHQDHRVARQADQARHAAAIAPLTTWFWALACLLALAAALWAAHRLRAAAGRADGRTLLGRWDVLCLSAASLPLSSYLANVVPWWRAPVPALALAVLSLAIAGAIGALLAVVARRRPLGAWGLLGAATAATLCVDVATGGTLQFCSPFGLPLLNGGRFYGFSNTAFGLLAAGAVMAATVAARVFLRRGRRSLAVSAVVATAAVVIVLDAAPSFGADFGGPIPLIVGFAVLLVGVGGWRFSWRRALLVCLGAVALLAAISVWDYSRGPEQWSHLGGFVNQVMTGQAWATIMAKARANGVLLLAAVPAAALVAFLAWRVRRWLAPTKALSEMIVRFAPLGTGLASAAIIGLVATPINDSGGAILAAGAIVLLPSLAPALAAARLGPTSYICA